eukprot:7307330-Pyramimonas_sp.AAC.1
MGQCCNWERVLGHVCDHRVSARCAENGRSISDALALCRVFSIPVEARRRRFRGVGNRKLRRRTNLGKPACVPRWQH